VWHAFHAVVPGGDWSAWRWKDFGKEFIVPAGEHTLKFYVREAKTRLRRIRIKSGHGDAAFFCSLISTGSFILISERFIFSNPCSFIFYHCCCNLVLEGLLLLDLTLIFLCILFHHFHHIYTLTRTYTNRYE
jgi:hypothetical protein